MVLSFTSPATGATPSLMTVMTGHVREVRPRTGDGIGGFRAEIPCSIRGGDGQRRAVLLGRAERHGEVAA